MIRRRCRRAPLYYNRIAYNLQVVHRPDPDQSLQKLRERRRPVPHQPADEDVLQHLECGRLGVPGRAGQDRLEQSAVRRQVPEPEAGRLRVRECRQHFPVLLIFQLVQWMAVLQADCRAAGPDELGAAELQDLRLLHRLQEI